MKRFSLTDESRSAVLDYSTKTALILVTISAILYVALTAVADPDLWGHVRFGQDTLHIGKVASIDPYLYPTAEFSWIDHEWLAEVLMAFSYNHARSSGLVVLKGFIIISLILLIVKVVRSSGFGFFSSSFLLFTALILMSPGISTVRPQLFTYLFFTATCISLRLASTGQRKWLGLLPCIMIIWANCHGGFLAGIMLLFVWAAVTTVVSLFPGNYTKHEQMKDLYFIWLIFILSGLATLVNPYGTRLLLFLFTYAITPQPQIAEWQSIHIISPRGILYLICMAIVFLSLIYSKKRKDPAILTIICAIQIAPLVAIRHLPLFAIASIVLASDHIEDCWQQVSHRCGFKAISNFSNTSKAMLVIVLLVASCIISQKTMDSFGKLPIVDYLPVRAIDLLTKIKGKANIANYLDWGDYIIWRLGPRIKVSIDGLRDYTCSPKIYTENMAFMDGVSVWSSILDNYPTDLVLIPKCLPCYSLLKLMPGWQIVYEDDCSAMFARRNSALSKEIQSLPSIKPFSIQKPTFFE